MIVKCASSKKPIADIKSDEARFNIIDENSKLSKLRPIDVKNVSDSGSLSHTPLDIDSQSIVHEA